MSSRETSPDAPAIPLATLAEGSLTRVVHRGRAVLLVRSKGSVHAVADACTHDDVSLSLGSLCNYRLRCPLHGSEFDIRDGRVLSEPADADLATWPVRVVDGNVIID